MDDQLASKISDEDHKLIFCNVEDLLAMHKVRELCCFGVLILKSQKKGAGV